MKNIVFFVLAGFFFQLSFAGNLKMPNCNCCLDNPGFLSGEDTLGKTDMRELSVSQVKTRAIRNFVRSFADFDDMKWYAIDIGYVVYFKVANIPMKAIYNRGGDLLNTYSFFEEKNMPKDLREYIKKEYDSYAIYKVVKMEEHNKVAYYIKMHDRVSLLEIKIYNEQIEETENFKKSYVSAGSLN